MPDKEMLDETVLDERTSHNPEPHSELMDIGRRWADAEVAKDVETLNALAHPQFRLVGPLGFVLDRDAWLQRYQPGQLDTTELSWDEVAITVLTDTAVSIGRQRQRATYAGHRSDGDYRVTHIFVREPAAPFGWLIAGMHLSPIAQPAAGPDGSPS